MAITIDVDADLRPFAPDIDPAKAAIMIADAMALAAVVAPCILEDDFKYATAAKAIIRGAILRWNDSGTGAATQLSAGPFQQTLTTAPRRSMFWPSEITDLQNLCADATNGKAFTVDTMPVETPDESWDGTGIWPWVG